MLCRSLNHVVTGTIRFNDHHIRATFLEQFIWLVGLESGEFACADRTGSNSYTLILFPTGIDHFEQAGCLWRDNKGISFALLRKINVCGGSSDDALSMLCQFAGQRVHG